ncbi:hypothetical protein XBI1_3080051 [Xenorhabdus bovienii str. Intermedium]|uniref:Uncharacterized protein n=1 Tax=Xenorhabdus bovienii str. Intermedium TaxID=1379677 RepID=A0A077QEI6_XENBV|nr:hypothetical protein XBI1_3080051 [Xenorhabdus bovienii str. Intermedium]
MLIHPEIKQGFIALTNLKFQVFIIMNLYEYMSEIIFKQSSKGHIYDATFR